MDKARAFISNPAAAEAAKTSGVLDGEYHFLESARLLSAGPMAAAKADLK